MTREHNPPAFATPPLYNPNTGDYIHGQPGMSLRDWFAGQIIPVAVKVCGEDEREPGETMAQMCARRAYEVADAMLAERAKGGER